jgi:hypothetical protein
MELLPLQGIFRVLGRLQEYGRKCKRVKWNNYIDVCCSLALRLCLDCQKIIIQLLSSKTPWTPWMRLQHLPHWDSEISWNSLRLRSILSPTRRESYSQIEHSHVLTLQIQQCVQALQFRRYPFPGGPQQLGGMWWIKCRRLFKRNRSKLLLSSQVRIDFVLKKCSSISRILDGHVQKQHSGGQKWNSKEMMNGAHGAPRLACLSCCAYFLSLFLDKPCIWYLTGIIWAMIGHNSWRQKPMTIPSPCNTIMWNVKYVQSSKIL